MCVRGVCAREFLVDALSSIGKTCYCVYVLFIGTPTHTQGYICVRAVHWYTHAHTHTCVCVI